MMFLSGSAQDGARRLCASWLPAMGGQGGSICSWCSTSKIFLDVAQKNTVPHVELVKALSTWAKCSSPKTTSHKLQKPRQAPLYHCKSSGSITRQDQPNSLIPEHFISPMRSQETSIKDGSVHLSFAVRMGMGGGDPTWEALEAPSIHNTIMFEVIV